MRFRLTAVLIGALAIVAPQIGSAATTPVTFGDASSTATCDQLAVGSTCTATGDATTAGTLNYDLSVASPGDGAAPGLGYARGEGRLLAAYTVAGGTTSQVMFDVTVHVNSASASQTTKAAGVVHTAGTGNELADSGASLTVSLSDPSCPQCAGDTITLPLVNGFASGAPRTLTNRDFNFQLGMYSFDGNIPAGRIYVDASLNAIATLGTNRTPDVGTASVHLDAAFASITATT